MRLSCFRHVCFLFIGGQPEKAYSTILYIVWWRKTPGNTWQIHDERLRRIALKEWRKPYFIGNEGIRVVHYASVVKVHTRETFVKLNTTMFILFCENFSSINRRNKLPIFTLHNSVKAMCGTPSSCICHVFSFFARPGGKWMKIHNKYMTTAYRK